MTRRIEHVEAKELLEAWNITQQQIADDVDCDKSLVSLVLNGKRTDRKGILDSIKKHARQAKRREQARKSAFAELMPAA